MTHQVVICGPNLLDQRKGQFHVHAAGCGDLKHYGPRGKFGGEEDGWEIEVKTPVDIVWAVYSDQLGESGEDEAGQDELADAWLSDFHFAPCTVPFFKTTPRKREKEATMANKTPNTNLGEDLVAALTTQWTNLTMVEKKAYRRLTVDGKTLGYLYLGTKVPAVEYSDGHGKYEYLPVRTKGDVKKVVTALKAVAKRQSK